MLALGFLFVQQSRAQQPQAPATTPSPAAAPPATGQVQGYTLTPGQEAQAIAYAHARHELYFLDVAYGLLLLVLILQLRVAPFFATGPQNGPNGFGQILVFTPLLFLTIDVLSLPTTIWGHLLALKYQQSIQGWGSWFADWAKGEGVEMAIAILLVWILYAVIRKSPRRWWFWFWVAAVPLIILGAVVEPLIVEPLFFKFTPLVSTEPRLAGISSRWHPRRRPDSARPHFRDERQRETESPERLRDRARRDQARRCLGHHHPPHERR